MAYVYTHTRLDTNEIFYVGIGSDNEYSRANTIKNRNVFWYRVVRKVDFKVDIVEDKLSWEEACIRERVLIKEYGRRDQKSGTLVNLTDGGEGLLNPSQEVRDVKSRKVTASVSGKSYEERYGKEKALELIKLRKENQKKVWDRRSKEQKEIIAKKVAKGHKGKKKTKQEVVKCPYCDIKGAAGIMKRWHFNNCKKKL
jgi:hypothetical protein